MMSRYCMYSGLDLETTANCTSNLQKAPHIDYCLNGVEILTNSSGSHFTLRKLETRLQLICEATRKNGGIYLYSNQLGCDGDRLYYDGSALIIVNGDIVAQGSQFALNEVEVITATVDLEEVRAQWYAPSRAMQAIQAPKYRRIETDFRLCVSDEKAVKIAPSTTIQPRLLRPEQEIAYATGCWLWDYLRRSGAAGFLIPLVSGVDNISVACF
jgi:NAD+ synthase (glutamine-hydrolysing)